MGCHDECMHVKWGNEKDCLLPKLQALNEEGGAEDCDYEEYVVGLSPLKAQHIGYGERQQTAPAAQLYPVRTSCLGATPAEAEREEQIPVAGLPSPPLHLLRGV